MKIGVSCYPTIGGSGIVATELGGELARRGHEVHFVADQIPYRLVTHGSILVNGKRTNIPSALLRAGDVISVTDRAKGQLRIQDALQLAEKVGFPAWVEVDAKKMTGTFKGAPERSEFGQDINESLVVELYSK